VTAPLSGEPDKKASPERGGGPSIDGGGILLWNLLLGVKGLRKHPSVTCGDSSPFRGAYNTKGSLIGEASPERGGEPAKLVEGFSVKSFAWCKGFTR